MEQGAIQSQGIRKKISDPVTPVKQLEQTGVSSELQQEKKTLRMPRTRKYIKMMEEIDRLSEEDKEIMEMIQSMPVNNKLLGILSSCGIEGCIIHAIDKWGNILAHFRSESEMSADLQAGYQVFTAHPGCISVEVYTYTFCVIYDDGTVKFIEREV